MNRASAAVRMVLICAASAAAFFVACSGPSQRAAALAELFAAWPATAHWRVPVGSVHNLHPAAEVIRALSTYPEVGLSARLLAIQAMLFAAVVWALLYGTFRDAIWARRETDVRRVGHGPRLAPVYPEGFGRARASRGVTRRGERYRDGLVLRHARPIRRCRPQQPPGCTPRNASGPRAATRCCSGNLP